MVAIRLSRGGSKKRPYYHIVATDSRKRRDSGYIERLGFFNPLSKGQAVRFLIEMGRYDYWISQGAQPSERVASLVKQHLKQAA